ncbi:MAG: nitrilase family protein [Crocinitomicaceae bacterium]|nr:nitrilase family protein [Crocinitomicaceae bacterium]
MQDLTITLVQADQKWENKTANFKHYKDLLKDCKVTDLIVLPEMFNTSFSMNTSLAEDFKTSESIIWLKQLAQEKNAAIYTSLMIKENRNHYNRGVFIESNGNTYYYDKRKTFNLAGEGEHFTRGISPTIVNYKGWRFQLQICYDLRFPEISRNVLINEMPSYDVLLYVANWPATRSAHWKTLLSSRAIENQSYVIGVNRIGKDGNNYSYSGDSSLIDPLGNVNSPSGNRAIAVTYTINQKNLTAIREKLPFLRDQE